MLGLVVKVYKKISFTINDVVHTQRKYLGGNHYNYRTNSLKLNY